MKPDHIYKSIVGGLGLAAIVLLSVFAEGQHVESVITFMLGWLVPSSLPAKAGAK
jgi:hypothetical protein